MDRSWPDFVAFSPHVSPCRSWGWRTTRRAGRARPTRWLRGRAACSGRPRPHPAPPPACSAPLPPTPASPSDRIRAPLERVSSDANRSWLIVLFRPRSSSHHSVEVSESAQGFCLSHQLKPVKQEVVCFHIILFFLFCSSGRRFRCSHRQPVRSAAATATSRQPLQAVRPGHHHAEHWLLLRQHQHYGTGQPQQHGENHFVSLHVSLANTLVSTSLGEIQ